jgi:hypothetical protein
MTIEVPEGRPAATEKIEGGAVPEGVVRIEMTAAIEMPEVTEGIAMSPVGEVPAASEDARVVPRGKR